MRQSGRSGTKIKNLMLWRRWSESRKSHYPRGEAVHGVCSLTAQAGIHSENFLPGHRELMPKHSRGNGWPRPKRGSDTSSDEGRGTITHEDEPTGAGGPQANSWSLRKACFAKSLGECGEVLRPAKWCQISQIGGMQ